MGRHSTAQRFNMIQRYDASMPVRKHDALCFHVAYIPRGSKTWPAKSNQDPTENVTGWENETANRGLLSQSCYLPDCKRESKSAKPRSSPESLWEAQMRDLCAKCNAGVFFEKQQITNTLNMIEKHGKTSCQSNPCTFQKVWDWS